MYVLLVPFCDCYRMEENEERSKKKRNLTLSMIVVIDEEVPNIGIKFIAQIIKNKTCNYPYRPHDISIVINREE